MPVSTPPSASQELRAESISGGPDGRPVKIDTDYTAVGDVTTLHECTQDDVLDKVFLTLWNTGTTATTIELVVSPVDDTVIANVDDATISVSCPPDRPVELPPLLVRRMSGNSYSVAAYAPNTNGDVRCTGRVVRLAQGDLTL